MYFVRVSLDWWCCAVMIFPPFCKSYIVKQCFLKVLKLLQNKIIVYPFESINWLKIFFNISYTNEDTNANIFEMIMIFERSEIILLIVLWVPYVVVEPLSFLWSLYIPLFTGKLSVTTRAMVKSNLVNSAFHLKRVRHSWKYAVRPYTIQINFNINILKYILIPSLK